jgi:hypothetical protein
MGKAGKDLGKKECDTHAFLPPGKILPRSFDPAGHVGGDLRATGQVRGGY